jgi:acylphosphatase
MPDENNTFIVDFISHETGSVEVEAASEEEAREKFEDAIANGGAVWGDSVYEVQKVERS